jgi:hypothetical protein
MVLVFDARAATAGVVGHQLVRRSDPDRRTVFPDEPLSPRSRHLVEDLLAE